MASITVTERPWASRFSATSRPMKPAPTTTARRAPASTAERMASASSGVRTVKTPGRSAPGSPAGTNGEAPVAMTNLSYVSPCSEPSFSRTVTSWAAASSATASTPVRTSTLVSPS